MRLALAQINPTIGDIPGNAALIARFTEQARSKGADLVVFPELALAGYPPRDLLLQEGFLASIVAAARALGEEHSRGITLVFGAPLPTDSKGEPGCGVTNSLLVYRDGAMIAYYDKRLLPTYDVFDEDRYFIPGDRPVVIETAGVRVGLSICEDLWKGEDVGFAHRYADEPDPVAELVRPPDGSPGAQVIINPSASPFVLGKGARHRELLKRHAERHGVCVAAVNQVGGNDELVFDGHAVAYGPEGELLAAAPGFEEHLLIVDLPPARKPAASLVPDPLVATADEELLSRALVLGVRDYCAKTGFKSVVLGLSGGIDSAVTCVIAAAALGPWNVHAVALPSRFSSTGSIDDARELAERLGVSFETIPIQPAVDALEASLAPAFARNRREARDAAEENLQSRVRGTILMGLSNKLGHLLLTTGNKSELAVGYCTLYGDMNGGLAVLSDVTKEWVYRLARWMNANPARLGLPPMKEVGDSGPIPTTSIEKPPSAELRPNQTDQDTLPPYPVLDEIIERYVERRQSPDRIARETGFEQALIARVIRMIDGSEFKRKQAAPGLKVTGVAFGSGRRVPIAQRYRPGPRPPA